MSPFIFDGIPEWAVFVGLILIFSGSAWVGFRFGQWRRQHAEALAEKEAQLADTASAAMLTLIGFLLGFTFSMAGSHFDSRRQLVIDDANIIDDTYATAGFLQEPYRSDIRRVVIDYVDFRPRMNDYERSTTQFDEFIRRSELLQEQMWDEGMVASKLDPTPLVASFIASLNTLTDIHNIRTDLRWNRIPPMVFLALAFMSTLAMGLVGYIRGMKDTPALLSVILLVVIYATVFTLVVDLDRHTDGLFFVSQQPMVELRDTLLAR